MELYFPYASTIWAINEFSGRSPASEASRSTSSSRTCSISSISMPSSPTSTKRAPRAGGNHRSNSTSKVGR
ncbi:Uncharacterised protein [Mycobacteroides abscessus subsp. abscessus]|nr:Uncharacterised protein [Mycobacteroides abscessus subsp. abscessus]